MEKVRILFVLSKKYSDESQVSQAMHQAYDVCQQNKCNAKWIKESDVDKDSVNKTDFVVFEEFKGSCFESLKQTKCALVGPWTISVCLLEGKPIPNYPWPIYNVAMYNCIVTASCLLSPKKAKAAIKTKVELMGGCYSDDLITKTTHLVVGSVMSEKYLLAAEANVSIMRPSWIEEVWKQSQKASVHASDEIFSEHRAKVFDGLTICSTCIPTAAERHHIEKIINDNGGKFTGKLVVADTNVLLCGGSEATRSEKYKAARFTSHIKCVTLNWVKDSLDKGYALPCQDYYVNKVTSTPTKNDYANPDISTLSAILPCNMSHRASVEDTLLNNTKIETKTNSKRKADLNYEDLVEKLDVKKAKRAGQYLDGYSIYVTGFNADQTEKLTKILNFSGATRNEKFSDSVTHVIVGDPSFHEVNLIRNKRFSCSLVSVQWLLDSIDQEKPVSEEKYLIGDVEIEHSLSGLGSPLSKKGLSLLRSNRTLTEKDADVDMEGIIPIPGECDENIVQQYLDNNTSSQDTLAKLLNGVDNSNLLKQVDGPPAPVLFKPNETSLQNESTIISTQEQSILPIFTNMKLMLLGHEEQEHLELRNKIEKLGGEVVPKNYKGVPDYAVVPVFSSNIRQTATEIVNDIFIEECENEGKLLDEILYYHRPHNVPDTKCLTNCVIAVSGYVGYERQFLKGLIEFLGGLAQEQFARVTLESKNVYGCTHLVCPTPTGKKYTAALKWGRAVVSKDWLLECAKTGKKAWEGDFVLGDSKPPEKTEQEKTGSSGERVSDENCAEGGFANTPETSRSLHPPGSSKTDRFCTPNANKITQMKDTFGITDQHFSPITPVNKIMRNFRAKSPEKPISAKKDDKGSTHYEPWDFIKTPDTPLGRIFTPDPSPRLRKMCEYWLMQFPDRSAKDSDSDASTPLSEIKDRLWNKILRKNVAQPNFDDSKENAAVSLPEEPKTPENEFLAGKFKQLEDMLTASGSGKRHSRNFKSINPAPAGNREYQDSQPCTVGWDFKQGESSPHKPIFTLSNLTEKEREQITFIIESLGGAVSELANYDPACSHLISPKPCRNEKPLACMAAGKWILHTNYIYESKKRARFLNEEEFEFGNPKSAGNFDLPEDVDKSKLSRSHWWRKEIARRGYKAFNDMRAIVVAQKREPIVRVIEAGGGVVVDVKPPFDGHVHATHCLIDNKYVSSDLSAYVPLAEQGIYLVPTVYISDYLYNPSKEIRDCVIPYFSKYYSRS